MTLVRQAMGSLRNVHPCRVQRFPTNCPETDDHETDNCCTLIPCCLCLTFRGPDGVTHHGEACWDAVLHLYAGTVDGREFELDWQQVYGECGIVVTLDGEIVWEQPTCQCENPAGETLTYHGTLTWERQKRFTRDIWDGTCEPDCPECRCVAEKICIAWEKKESLTGPCPDVCQLSILEAEWDCENEVYGPVIFEPDCQSSDEPITIAIRLGHDTYGSCIWILEVDGSARDSVRVGNCVDPGMAFEYIHPDGCLVNVETDGRACGCETPPREICCCPGRDVPESLFVTLYNRNECHCVDSQVIELTLQSYDAPSAGIGAGATWEGQGKFCEAGDYAGPGFNECDIRITLLCTPAPSCVWMLLWCTGGDGCGDLEAACATPFDAQPGSVCGGISAEDDSCDPLQIVFADDVNSDDCCCNPNSPASDFCFVVKEFA